MKFTSLSRHQWADLALLITLMVMVIWYFTDAYQASSQILNLIFLLPLSALVLLLCAIELFSQLRANTDVEQDSAKQADGHTQTANVPLKTVMPVILLFIAYVSTLPWLGFDVGTFSFIALFLYLHGEKRLQWTIAYGLVFAFVMAWAFSSILPYPMPMMILPSAY